MADLLQQIKEFPQKPDFGDSDLLLIQGQGTTYNVQGRAVKKYAEDSAKPQVELAKEEAQAAEAAAGRAEAAIQHPAIPDPQTGNWLVWDQVSESYQQTEPPVRAEGQDFEIRGFYPTLEALEAAVPEPDVGAAYGVGLGIPYDIYVWDAVRRVWVNNGALQGPRGEQGPQGPQGPVGPPGAAGAGIPVGGTAGQVLSKASAADHDVEWRNLPATGVTSFNGRKGDVAPASGDYRVAQITGAAPTYKPVFTSSISLGRKAGSDEGFCSCTLGGDLIASSSYAVAEGYESSALSVDSHAEGYKTIAGNSTENYKTRGAHAEGYKSKAGTTAPTSYVEAPHAEGYETTADGAGAHSEGYQTTASGRGAHAGGYNSTAIGAYSFAHGENVHATSYQIALGRNNATNNLGYCLMIGDGSTTSRSNCFRADPSGVHSRGPYQSSGADYAEMFEWADGNQNDYDRVGRFVTLEGAKIRLAGPEDDYILGIVSGSPSVVGDVYDDQWQGMYLTDIFGRPIWEDVEVPDVTEEREIPVQVVLDDGSTVAEPRMETVVIIPAHMERRQKLNPDYDNTQLPYIPRSERPEWDAVGMMGKLAAVDDGTCQVNGWAAVGKGGVATASAERTAYRVMERLDEGHVRVLIL